MLPIILLVVVPVEIRELRVDLLETNTVRYSDGSTRFVQVVAWDEGRDENNLPCAIDRGYKVVKDGYPNAVADRDAETVKKRLENIQKQVETINLANKPDENPQVNV